MRSAGGNGSGPDRDPGSVACFFPRQAMFVILFVLIDDLANVEVFDGPSSCCLCEKGVPGIVGEEFDTISRHPVDISDLRNIPRLAMHLQLGQSPDAGRNNGHLACHRFKSR